MPAQPYEITLISGAGKQTRTVIEHSAIKAIRTAIHTFDEPDASFAIICIPLGALPDHMEAQPCAA